MKNLPEYFDPPEFTNEGGDWWAVMSQRTIAFVDLLRYRLGKAIFISNNAFSLGRRLGPGSMSSHNIDQWDECLAIDCFVKGVYTQEEAEEVVRLAIQCGFTGIGVYADTTNNLGEKQVMFHLDTRPNERMGVPATWGRVHGAYSSMIEALKQLPAEVPK